MKLKIFFIVFFCLFKAVVIAQDTDKDEFIRIQSRLVLVPVSVLDTDGNPLKGLTKQDFWLSEEGKLQEIDELLEAEKTPLEIAILFDLSSSTETFFDIQREATIQFLQEVMRPEDYATIFSISSEPMLIQERTKSEQAVQAIKKLTPSKGFTAFYDTVAMAVDYLQKNAPPKSRKVILTISDGEDTNSTQIAT
ncbi:MAG: VWA domain-containing protein, partial [Pyrinomonadaceae bacterium]